MSTTAQGAVPAIQDVRAALETLGDALAGARLEDLLRVEPLLEAAVARFGAHAAHPADDAHALAVELAAMTGALARCRALGQALSDAAAILAEARGDAQAGYARDGREQPAAAVVRPSLEQVA